MFQELGRPEIETTPVKLLWHDRSIPDGLSGRRDRLYIGIDEMKEGVALPQLFSARFGAQVAICAIGPIAFETCAKVERADGIASMTIGARFPGIGKIHVARAVGLQQHLDQRVGAPLLAEVFLIVHE